MQFQDNEQINIEFAIAVEEFPCLYNYKLKEYSNRNVQDKAWRHLAEKFNAYRAKTVTRMARPRPKIVKLAPIITSRTRFYGLKN